MTYCIHCGKEIVNTLFVSSYDSKTGKPNFYQKCSGCGRHRCTDHPNIKKGWFNKLFCSPYKCAICGEIWGY